MPMTEPRQQIRFCTSPDGSRIAYAVTGRGPPLVYAPHWLTHLEHDWESILRRPWLTGLSRDRTLVRFDQRGNGLSDPSPPSFAFERWLEDLEAVVNAAGLERFDLFGASQGGAAAVAYAARHPEQVSRLVLYGAYPRGQLRRDESPAAAEEAQALLSIVRMGWGRDDPAFRHVFTMKFMPDGTAEHRRAFDELARTCISSENAVRLLEEFFRIDVRREAEAVRCPTLVVHARHDLRVPHAEGRLLASLIPGARFVTLESRNHFLCDNEPAYATFLAEVRAFLAKRDAEAPAAFPGLTAREGEVLELVAHGLDNAQIAARLGLSEKTVRNNMSALFDKLEVENRAQAIVRARDAGYGRQPL